MNVCIHECMCACIRLFTYIWMWRLYSIFAVIKKVKSVGFSIMLFNFIYNESSGAKTFANHLVFFVDINVVSENIAAVVITITKS